VTDQIGRAEFESFADLDDYLGKVTDEILAKRQTSRKRR